MKKSKRKWGAIPAKFFFTLIMLSAYFSAYTQINITYPVQAEGMTVCLDPTILTIRVDLGGTQSSTDNVITVHLAEGVEYVIGTVTKTGGTSTLDITDAGGTSGQPQFTITPATMQPGDYIVFTIKRTASCQTSNYVNSNPGVELKDYATVSGSIGNFGSKDNASAPYNANYPVISNFIQPTEVTDAVTGGSYSRTLSFSNGSTNGDTGEVHFYMVYPDGGLSLNKLEVNGITVSPTHTHVDTTFFTFSGALLGDDGLLTNGETLNLKETFTVKSCNPTTNYGIGWGCSASPTQWCQTVKGTGVVSTLVGVSDFSVSSTALIDYVNMCTPTSFKTTITNTGVGTPEQAAMYNITLVHTQGRSPLNNMVSYLYMKIGTKTATYSISTDNNALMINAEQFTSDPDGPGVGLEDLDGDGQYDDLLKGESIEITVGFQHNDIANSCTAETAKYYYYPFWAVDYSRSCNETIHRWNGLKPSVPRGFYYYGDSKWGTTAVDLPPNVIKGEPFTVEISTVDLTHNWPSSGNMQSEYWVKLPTGFTVSDVSSVTFNKLTPGEVRQSNDTLYIKGKLNAPPYRVAFDLVSNDDNCGEVTATYGLNYYDDVSATTPCNYNKVWFCNRTFTIDKRGCSITCPTGGTVYSNPKVQRSIGSLGYTDRTLQTRIGPSNLSRRQLASALFGDTLVVSGWAKQIGAANNFFNELRLDKGTGGLDKLRALDAAVQLYRGNMAVGATCTVTSADTSGSTASVTSLEWDLTSCFSGGIQDQDSIVMTARYIVINNDALDINADNLAQGALYSFYNKPDPTTKQLCTPPWTPEMFLIGTYNRFFSENNGHVAGCRISKHYFRSYEKHKGNDIFVENGEYRPQNYLDSIKFTVSDAIIIKKMVVESKTTSTLFREYSNPIIRGNDYIFVNDGHIYTEQVSPSHYNYTQTYALYYTMKCGRDNPGKISAKAYYRNHYYTEAIPYGTNPTKPASYLEEVSTPTYYTIYRDVYPDLTLTNESGVVQAIQNKEHWDIKLSNQSLVTNPYLWLALEDQPGITITSVIDRETGNTVTPTSYSGGTWYKLSEAGLVPAGSKLYRVEFTYTSCQQEEVTLKAGFSCVDYPTDPTTATCGVETLQLPMKPRSTEVQLSNVGEQISTTVSLCTTLSHKYIVNNAGDANVKNNIFTINVPTGMSISNFQVRYPNTDVGTWQTLTPSVSGNNNEYDLTTHDNYPATGLPGADNMGGVNENRQIGITFSSTTDCDFVSGDNFKVSTAAKAPCSQLAQGSNVVYQGPIINITGATQSTTLYETNNTISNTSLQGCSVTSTVNFTTKIVGGDVANNTGRINITIPTGFNYVANSFNAGTSGVIFGSATTNGSQEEVVLIIPAGTIAGTTLAYSIAISSDLTATCGSKQIDMQTTEVIGALSCGGTLCSSSQAVTGSASGNITLKKPNIILNNLQVGVVTTTATNEELKFTVTAQNRGSDVIATDDTYINIYNDANGNANYDNGTDAFIGSITVGSLASGTTATFSNTFTVGTASNSCTFLAVIDYQNVQQPSCVCSRSEDSGTLLVPTANAGSNATICENGTHTLSNASVTNANYITWSTSGSGTFSPTANVLQPTYTPSVADLSAGSVALTLSVQNSIACDVVSSTMSLSFDHLPQITTQPQDVVTCLNTVATLSVATTISSTATLQYQWQSTTNTATDTWGNISGANGATYNPPTNMSGTVYYRVGLSIINTQCSMIYSNPAQVEVKNCPLTAAITADKTICSGGSVSITVTITGGTPIYTIVYPGATTTLGSTASGTATPTATYTFVTGALTTDTTYDKTNVRVTDAGGNMATYVSSAQITVLPIADNSFTLSDGVVCPGGSITLTLSGSESGVTYELQTVSPTTGNVVASAIGTGNAINFAVSPSVTTVYQVAATKGSCKTILSDKGTVRYATRPIKSYTFLPTETCVGNTATIRMSGSEIGVQYQLQTTGGTNVGNPVPGSGSIIYFNTGNVVTNTTYNVVASVIGVTTSDCTATLDNQPSVTVIPAPTFTVTTADISCFNSSPPDGWLEVTPTSGDGPFTIELYKDSILVVPGGTITNVTTSHKFEGLDDGDYYVKVTNSKGCVQSKIEE